MDTDVYVDLYVDIYGCLIHQNMIQLVSRCPIFYTVHTFGYIQHMLQHITM